MLGNPICLILIPFFAALLTALADQIFPRLIRGSAILGSVMLLAVAVSCLVFVMEQGTWTHVFGGWLAPYGIEFKLDTYGAAFICIIALVYLSVLIGIDLSQEHKQLLRNPGLFYCLLSLCIVGLIGLVISADIFNIYVFIEISSLTSYGLIGLAGGRALIASFQYLILGSLGACFYLLGIGYIYIKTGTLNIADLAVRIEPVLHSSSITIACILILVGLLLKMGVFPLNSWLPDSYCSSLPIVRCVLAPLATKTAAFVLLKIFFFVFGLATIWAFPWSYWFTVFISLGIIIASLQVMAQKKLQYVFAYLIVVEVGYITAGVFSGHIDGFYGAAFHILADALMMAVLFISTAPSKSRNELTYSDIGQMKATAPLRVLALFVAMLSILGLPLTMGFVSKWYFLHAAIAGHQWAFFIALIFSSLCSLVVLARMLESLFFSGSDRTQASEYRSNIWLNFALTLLLVTLVVGGYFGEQIMQTVVIKSFGI